MKPISKDILYTSMGTQLVAIICCIAGFGASIATDGYSKAILPWFVATAQCTITWVMLYKYESKRICADLADWLADKRGDLTGKKINPAEVEESKLAIPEDALGIVDIMDMKSPELLERFTKVCKDGDFSKCDYTDDTVLFQQLEAEVNSRLGAYDNIYDKDRKTPGE